MEIPFHFEVCRAAASFFRGQSYIGFREQAGHRAEARTSVGCHPGMNGRRTCSGNRRTEVVDGKAGQEARHGARTGVVRRTWQDAWTAVDQGTRRITWGSTWTGTWGITGQGLRRVAGQMTRQGTDQATVQMAGQVAWESTHLRTVQKAFQGVQEMTLPRTEKATF